MRSTVLFATCLIALSACSKSDAPAEGMSAPAAGTAASNAAPAVDAKGAALVLAVKQDVAAGFVTTAADACGGVKGQEAPDPKSGAPMSYSAAGVIGWGQGSLDYVKEPAAMVTVTDTRADKSFAFGVYIHDPSSRARRYIASLNQMPGQPMNASVTDETQVVKGDTHLATGNQCEGGTAPPPLIAQGLWPVAAKHLQLDATAVSCTNARFEQVIIQFSFDGKTLQAGKYSFTAADAAFSETLTVDPSSALAKVSYEVDKDGTSRASIGLSEAGVLTHATLHLPGDVHWICSPTQ